MMTLGLDGECCVGMTMELDGVARPLTIDCRVRLRCWVIQWTLITYLKL